MLSAMRESAIRGESSDMVLKLEKVENNARIEFELSCLALTATKTTGFQITLVYYNS